LIRTLLLATVLGPGVLAGTLAIALRSVGFIGKLLYKAIEAIEATGASAYGLSTTPSCRRSCPHSRGITVFRRDINIQDTSVVGAGGVSFNLEVSLKTLAWSQVSVMLIAILVSAWISGKIRHSLI
jgi:phosphonate transport system permease protein